MATNFGQLLNNSLGGFLGLPKMASIESIILHIQNRLPQFATENRGGSITNENGLTQRLVHVLSLDHKLPYFFDKEFIENETKGRSARSDFAVITNQCVKFDAVLYQGKSRILTFEAKRLASLKTAREREYLEGKYFTSGKKKGKFDNSGGVERFKNETHGLGLDQAGIIGYIQEEDFTHWEGQIKTWTDNLITRSPVRGEVWSSTDYLDYQSQHLPDWKYYKSDCTIAKGTKSMVLHHIWVDLV
ncbi:MAG: hypothetical protein SF053_04500 [Bacteroidia bacterium]|nr:hypothetical protein [Bacteroidia bacterium]